MHKFHPITELELLHSSKKPMAVDPTTLTFIHKHAVSMCYFVILYYQHAGDLDLDLRTHDNLLSPASLFNLLFKMEDHRWLSLLTKTIGST